MCVLLDLEEMPAAVCGVYVISTGVVSALESVDWDHPSVARFPVTGVVYNYNGICWVGLGLTTAI